jgi:2'-5' RNA ligase
MPRLFVAIKLPSAVTDSLAAIQPAALPGVRVADRDQMHLTLNFLGEVDDRQALAVAEALGTVRGEPFTIALKGVGQFSPQGEPQFLWVGVCDSPPLCALHRAVGVALAGVGVPLEDRPYSPHVTLARVDSPSPAVTLFLEQHRDFEIDSVPIRQFALYSSVQTAAGRTYQAEKAFALGDASGP